MSKRKAQSRRRHISSNQSALQLPLGPAWLASLVTLVNRAPVAVFRFSNEEWEALLHSKRGISEFTVARAYHLLRDVRVPRLCFLVGADLLNEPKIYCCLLRSRSNNTTLESRLRFSNACALTLRTEKDLLALATEPSLKELLRARLKSADSVVKLSPALSGHLIARIADNPQDRHALRALSMVLDAPSTYSGNDALQADAIALALKAFGLAPSEAAGRVDVTGEKVTGLSRVSIREDAVIEHDARTIPGFALLGSDLTGRAIFRRGNEVLQVITANKRPLEEVLGVDLIYFNAVRRNIVMLQYKMLEPHKGGGTDWIYRPDDQLYKEIQSMKRFAKVSAPRRFEYRLNPQVFYLRFVQRDATLGKNAITMPLEHFELLMDDPKSRGPRGAFRISYDSLDGRYLRQEGFLELLQSGYIGAYTKDTSDLEALVLAVVADDRAVIAALQFSLDQGIR